jgi:polynucleotide 5'-hydroxyl-kinase GRC3/NOL9
MNGEDSRHLQHFPFLTRIEVLPEWEAAAERFLSRGGTAVVLGASDTGKSTLSRYLVYRAYAAGSRVALVDLDLGQSHLGPPTTLGLGLYPPRVPGEDSLFPEAFYFIGQTSPVGTIMEVAVGCRVLADLAAHHGVSRLVVNTSGLVHGLPALRLKRGEVELLQPALIFALQRTRELEPLLRALGEGPGLPSGSLGGKPPPRVGGGPGEGEAAGERVTPSHTLPHHGGGMDRDYGWTTVRLPVSFRARRRNPEERRLYREEGFRRYFQQARALALPWRAFLWEGLPLGRGEPLEAATLKDLAQGLGVPALGGESQGRRLVLLLEEEPPARLDPDWLAAEGWETVHWLSWTGLHLRLVGLLDARHRTLALGLVLPAPWDPEALALWTPLPGASATQVRFLKVGRMRVSPEGRELS